MTDNNKQYDLEVRTLKFARKVRQLVRVISRNIPNIEEDFLMRIKILRKEVKESKYWLELVDVFNDEHLAREQRYLSREAIGTNDDFQLNYAQVQARLDNI